MRFLPLLLANLKRKKIRTTLTIGSFVVAFFLFGLLGAIRYGFRQGIDVAGADRLVVIGRTSIIQPLPLPYFDRSSACPGVKDVAHSTWFGGVYQDPKNFFAQFAIVPEDWLRMYPEFIVDPAQWKAFLDDRQGCVIGAKLAERFGWKIGDKIPLKVPGYFGGGSWDFYVRAIYHGTRDNDDETQFWLRHDYLYEKAPAFWKGIVGWYIVRVANPDQSLAGRQGHRRGVRATPRRNRARRPSPRLRRPWSSRWATSSSSSLAIGAVVFFTLLLVTGNTMAIAVRERTNELATLKAIGFTSRFVLGLVLAESLLIAALGGALGLVAGARSSRSRTSPTACSCSTCRSRRSSLGLVIALVTGLMAGADSRGQRDAAQRRHRAPEALRWRSRSSTTSAACRRRWASSLVAMLGIAGTVAVFVAMLALARGFQATIVSSGLPQNAIVQQAGSDSEMTSAIAARRRARRRGHAAGGAAGRRALVSAEVVVIAALPLRGTEQRRQRADARRLAARAAGARQRPHRPGTLLPPGLYEIVVGTQRRASLCRASTSASTVRIGPGTWTVVGIMDAGGSAFDSEIWADADVLNGNYAAPGRRVPVGDRAAAIRRMPFRHSRRPLKGDPRARSAGLARAGVLRQPVAAGHARSSRCWAAWSPP